MRILHAVEFYSPSVGGAQEVVRQISRRLATRGHDVTVAISADPRRRDACIEGVTVAPFKVSGNRVNGFTGDVEAYAGSSLQADSTCRGLTACSRKGNQTRRLIGTHE